MPLSPTKQAELDALLEDLYGGETLTDFIPRVTPFEPPAHVAPIIDLFERARTEPVRAIVAMPPGHSKTTTCQVGLVWRIMRDPASKNAYISYAANIAHEKSLEMLRMARDAGVSLSADQQARRGWTTPYQGGMRATGVGGELTGYRITGMAVIDDYFKGRTEAESPTMRRKLLDWYRAVLVTRIVPGASIIVVATRWHPDDLSGYLLKHEAGWEVVHMPAVNEAGEALWPEVYPRSVLDDIRTRVGDYDWTSLYQGQPRSRGSEIFGMPGEYETPEKWDKWIANKTLITCVDPAATAKTSADYSAVVTMAKEGKGDDALYYVVDVQRFQVTVPELVRRVAAITHRWGGSRVGVESVGGFKAVPQTLREIDSGLQVIEIAATTDKFTRAQPLSAAWNAGRVLVPKFAPWRAMYLDEMMGFTGLGDEHDDMVDGTAHAFTLLSKKQTKRRAAPSLGSFG